MKLLRIFFTFLISSIHLQLIVAQSFGVSSSASSGKGWSANPFEQFVFVENKGQFDQLNSQQQDKIYYYANSKGVNVYFSAGGLRYIHDEYRTLLSERQREKMERDGRGEPQKQVEVKHHYLQVEWVGANPSVVIESTNAEKFYFTYANAADTGRTTFKAGCYKKIIYKELYPNIDVEYILPEKGGVKYSLILHPGADLSQVKMRYNGAKGLKKDREGNIIIKSEFGDFIDHAPVSFYADNQQAILSSFSVKNDIVSFRMDQPETFNRPVRHAGTEPRTIIVDPWNNNPAFPVNKAYDVNYDQAGNVYICGSGSTTQMYKLAKYNSAGVLQWVFSTNIGPTLGNTCYGDFAVDEITGTTYLLGMWAAAIKVNTLGVQTGGYASSAFPGLLELWRCEYNRCLNTIVVGTGSMGGPYQSGILDTSLLKYTPVNSYSAPATNTDIAIMAIDPNNSFCYMSTSSGGVSNNGMVKLPIPALFPPVWGPVATGHTFVEVGSITYTPNIPTVGPYSNGFNGMACGPQFVYTYDGSALKKWNKNTGAFMAQVTTGGTMFATGGLSADKCDNVYAGVGNVIKEYNSSLTLIATYPVANNCYDVKLGPNNKLYACGIAFVASIDVPALTPPTATSTPASGCNACNGTATAHPCGDPAGYTYLWNTGGQVTQTATGLCPGTYTVTITYACIDTNVVTVSVTGGAGGITLSSTQTNACSNVGSITVTASGGATPYTYSWSNGQTSAAITGLSTGMYTVTATDANGCSTFKIFQIRNKINVSYTTQYSNCSGGTSGSIALNVSGGNPSYTYNWSNGQTSATATGLTAGTYTVTVNDASGCIQTLVSTLPAYAPIAIQTDQTTACTGPAQATITSVTGGTPYYNYSWSNGQLTSTATTLAPGIYTVTVSDANGCTTTGSVTIGNGPNPAKATFTQSPTGIICKGTTVNFTNTGSTGTLVSHKWTIPGEGPVITGNITDFSAYFLNFTYTFTKTGTFTVRHTVSYPSGGCVDTVATTITVIDCLGPVVSAIGNSVCNGTCATVTSTANNGTIPYTYSWSSGETSPNISPCPGATTIYTLTITDATAATSTATAVVTVNPAVNVTATATNPTCNGAPNSSVSASPGGGTTPYTYSWSSGQTTSMISNLSSQSYTVTITDNKGCTAVSTATINLPPPLAGQFIKGSANCTGCGCKEWIMLTATGGTSPYSYLWSDGYVNRYKNHLCSGTYLINVMDKNGCAVNLNITAP